MRAVQLPHEDQYCSIADAFLRAQVSQDGVDYDELRAAPAEANLTWLSPSPHARQRATFEGYMLALADPGVKYDVVWLRCGRRACFACDECMQ